MNSILLFIIVFGILVVVHEFGHFIVSKWAGVLVKEFSVGMGPIIVSIYKGETLFTLRLLPLGGYVRLAGMEEEPLKPGMYVNLGLDDEGRVKTIYTKDLNNQIDAIPFTIADSDLEDKMFVSGFENGQEDKIVNYEVDKYADIQEENGKFVKVAPIERQIQNQSPLIKFFVNIAGPFNNVILAIIAFGAVAFISGSVPITNSGVVVQQTQSGSVATKSGIKKDDQILKYNDKEITNISDLQAAIEKHHPEGKTPVEIKRGSKEKTIILKSSNKKVASLGVSLRSKKMSRNPLDFIKYGFNQTLSQTKQIFTILGTIFTGNFSINQLSGPVGIYATVNEVSKSNSVIMILGLLASLSISLAIMNLIPIPALDGGKIILNFIEMIIRRPIPVKLEVGVTIAGALFLILLMILVTVNDVFRYFVR